MNVEFCCTVPIWANWAVRPCLHTIWNTDNKKNTVIQTTDTLSSSSWMTWQTSTEMNSLSVSSFSCMDQTFWRTYCSNVFLLLLLSKYEGSTCRGRYQGLFFWSLSKENCLYYHILRYLLINSDVFKINFIFLQDC